jgi:hypothetical protein
MGTYMRPTIRQLLIALLRSARQVRVLAAPARRRNLLLTLNRVIRVAYVFAVAAFCNICVNQRKNRARLACVIVHSDHVNLPVTSSPSLDSSCILSPSSSTTSSTSSLLSATLLSSTTTSLSSSLSLSLSFSPTS